MSCLTSSPTLNMAACQTALRASWEEIELRAGERGRGREGERERGRKREGEREDRDKEIDYFMNTS